MSDRPVTRPQIVLATRNRHKLIELGRMCPGIDWLPLPEELGDPPETSDTFEGNALQKARYVFERLGLPALADDSGLEVDALGGRPGVWSKRYSPEATDAANNALLLSELRGLPRAARTARYRCVLALVYGPGAEATVAGACEGHILEAPRGSRGFGYDPLFEAVATPGRSCGELEDGEKDAISHRGAAVERLPELLRQLK